MRAIIHEVSSVKRARQYADSGADAGRCIGSGGHPAGAIREAGRAVNLPRGVSEISHNLQYERNKWTYTGEFRPPFADVPSAGQESVWDYPRPPAVITGNRTIVVKKNGRLLASSTQALKVLETASPPTLYIPIQDIRMELIVQIPQASSLCEWKGYARYWCYLEEEQKPVAWDYPQPFSEYSGLCDHVAFYPAHTECYVSGERVRPQSGGFYGGWVTAEVTGPFKGAPNSEQW